MHILRLVLRATLPFTVGLLSVNLPAQADTSYTPKVVNYATTIPVGYPSPALMPFGYFEAARAKPQVIMTGVAPSIIDATDSKFDILALVRPGTNPVQRVALSYSNNQVFITALSHVNTLKNGDQLWKATYSFTPGTFGNSVVPIKWGTGFGDYFAMWSSDTLQNYNGSSFPDLRSGIAPRVTPFMDSTKNDVLTYNPTKRAAAQIVMAGVSPAVIDLADTGIDIIAVVRPGKLPLESVQLKQVGSNLFTMTLEKQKELNNGDEIWVTHLPFSAGFWGTSIISVVWGTEPGQFNLQTVDIAQQTAIAYPVLRANNFNVQ